MAINSRQKGKRIERFFATLLRPFFPDIRRNAGTQSQSGGVDLENCDPFNFEIKGGKNYDIVAIQKIIDQVKQEGKGENINVALVKPDRKDWYAIIPQDDFLRILEVFLSKHQ